MILWLIVGCIVLAAFTGGLTGAVLVGANHPVPQGGTVTVQLVDTDEWYPLPMMGGGRPTEQR